MIVKSMNDFFVAELQRLYGEEKHVAKVLPKLGKAASFPQLTTMFSDFEKETKTHLKRLEDVFAGIGKKAVAKECPRVKGLCTECEAMAGLEGESHVRDVALIAATQHLTHDQIAGYGCLRTWAKVLGKAKESELLQKEPLIGIHYAWSWEGSPPARAAAARCRRTARSRE